MEYPGKELVYWLMKLSSNFPIDKESRVDRIKS